MIKVEEWNQSVYRGKGIPPLGGGGVSAENYGLKEILAIFCGLKEFDHFFLRNLVSDVVKISIETLVNVKNFACGAQLQDIKSIKKIACHA